MHTQLPEDERIHCVGSVNVLPPNPTIVDIPTHVPDWHYDEEAHCIIQSTGVVEHGKITK